jgi:hypothetical protein
MVKTGNHSDIDKNLINIFLVALTLYLNLDT